LRTAQVRKAHRNGEDAGVSEVTLYERVGGTPFFVALVERFYAGVAEDPELLALYPEPDDLGPARERLTLFLVQYWGGPTTYSDERGHPRLRLRHAPFAIGPLERDRWLVHMRAAIQDVAGDDPEAAGALHAYVTMAAEAMQNRA
jgi:hemoglobin